MDASELVLNERGGIYHIDVKPGELATRIITVGDPMRGKMIAHYFDKIHFSRSHREFTAVTGEFSGQLLSVISTGIGTDNIDIVLSEIDAVFNIDLQSKLEKTQKTTLQFIRLGTSGALHPDIQVGDIVLSKYSVGLDNLLDFYSIPSGSRLSALEEQVTDKISYPCYAFSGHQTMIEHFETIGKKGITFSCPGFYGPQGRSLRIPPKNTHFLRGLQSINYEGVIATNFEMETSAIYGLSSLMGHKAVSISTILANRIHGNFSRQPEKEVQQMIEKALENITGLN
mgnify:CR=1 FL=1